MFKNKLSNKASLMQESRGILSVFTTTIDALRNVNERLGLEQKEQLETARIAQANADELLNEVIANSKVVSKIEKILS